MRAMRYSKEGLVEELAVGSAQRFRLFWRADSGGDFRRLTDGCLSQWWPASFEVDGVRYTSAEQFMMAEKARLFRNHDALERILRASGPGDAKVIGREVRGFETSAWEKARTAIVRCGNLAKFGQDYRLESFLLGTGSDVLAEASPKDAIWGIGLSENDPRARDPSQWPGKNLLGFILMEVRDILTTKRQLDISREDARRLGHEAVEIIRSGRYTTATGLTVSIARHLDAARSGTIEYEPTDPVETPARSSGAPPIIEVTCETTLAAARRLRGAGLEPTALNFASATSPCGGFLRGSRAQEEYLARSSGLYGCLVGQKMYSEMRGRLDPFYADFVIYTPAVPIIRDDTSALLDEPWTCGIITSPAVHAKGVRRYCPERLGEIEATMRRRIRRVLSVAAAHDCRALVLGAWGCGAFGNDPTGIARLFHEGVDEMAGAFDRVVFAVTDWSPERRFVGPFEQAFSSATSLTP